MTNTIGPLSSGHAAREAASQSAANTTNKQAAPPPDTQAPPAGAAQASEAVTLSATSQATAQLLDAARAADGVDEARVAQLRGAVQSGTYDVAPEDVAKAIAGAGIGQAPLGASGNGTS